VKHQQVIHRAAFAEIKAHEGGEQHERGEPRLDEIGEDCRPTFFVSPVRPDHTERGADFSGAQSVAATARLWSEDGERRG
jgi:hypothetical protein